MTKRALVTGGAGFIGSHLVGRLVWEGWQVRILDNFSSGCWDNLRSMQADIEIVVGDTRDKAACYKACQGVESVFHLAAIASVASSIEDPVLSHEVTFGGTLNMLLAARDQGVRRFIFSSSAAVYGNSDVLPTLETQPLSPQSPYASDKACSEFYCRNFQSLFDLETVILRYFNVFGPRQSAHSGYAAVIPRFVQAAVTGGTPIVYGDGQQTRDFVCVDNVVSANLQAALVDGIAGHTFNIAGGVSVSLCDLLQILERITGTTMTPNFLPARSGDVRHSRADITSARQLLGFDPTVSLTTGLKRTIEAIQGSGEDRALAASH
ncbi:MAG TPA: NAD-dependent epimerase/dehydratase family protein [Chthonomonadaceae bacterium]|nr:NAD-dependent epimerase/dehydratase family protein [Chthonomonadaceae bacterium]